MKALGDTPTAWRDTLGRWQRKSIDWIVAGRGVQTPDIQAHLLQHSLLNTVTLVMLLLSMLLIAMVAIARTGEVWAYAWLIAELLIGYAKLSFRFTIDNDSDDSDTAMATGPIVAGLAGGLVLGFAGYQCVMSGDPMLIVLSGICLGGLVGGTSVRAAGTPRFAIILMCSMALPYAFAALISPVPYLFLIGVQMPILLGGLIYVLNEDYKTLVSLYLAQRENRWLAHHDALTGLPNRTMKLKCFDDLLRYQDDAPPAAMPMFTVFCLDLDGFKDVNDNFGHAAGDTVLVMVADRLRNSIREIDFLFRVGGDEFVILLPSISPADATAIAHRIIRRIARPFEVGHGATFSIGISIGSAIATADGATADALLRCADRAMYEAKRRGKGIYVTLPATPDVVELASPAGIDLSQKAGSLLPPELGFPLPLRENPV